MRITRKLALGSLAALCLAAPACDDGKKDAKAETKQDAKAADAKAADVKAPEADAKAAEAKAADVKAAEADAKAGAGAPSADAPKIGVAECDEYIAAMTKCFASGGVPAEHLEQQKMGFDMSVQTWADAMKANPEGGSALVAGCKAALDMAKLSHPSCFQAK